LPAKSCMHSSSTSCLLYTLPISYSLTWSFYLYFTKRSYEAPF
jgi:hypothetical protein